MIMNNRSCIMTKILHVVASLSATALLLSVSSCRGSKDRPNDPSPDPITLEAGEVTVPEDGLARLLITAGSGQYSVLLPDLSTATAVTRGDTIILHGKSAGKVAAKVQDNITRLTADLQITVTSEASVLHLTQHDASLPLGSVLTLSVKDGSGDYIVQLSDESIAEVISVSPLIRIQGKTPGEVEVIVKDSKTGAQGVSQVTVSTRAFKLDLPELPLTFPYGESRTIGILSGNGSYDVVNSAPAVVTVEQTSGSFLFHGLKPGSAEVTITDPVSEMSYKIEVIVKLKPLTVQSQDALVEVLSGYDTTLKIISGNGSYELSSDAGEYFSASLEGDLITISPKAIGTGTLTVRDVQSGEAVELSIKVRDLINNGRVSMESITVKVGEKVNVLIKDAEAWGYYQWSTVDPSLVTLLPKGGWGDPHSCDVKGVKPGTTVIQLSQSVWGMGTQIIQEIPVTVVP